MYVCDCTCDFIRGKGLFEMEYCCGCLQLFWPDDGNWYSVVINAINVKKRMATCVLELNPTIGKFGFLVLYGCFTRGAWFRIQYDTGEIEELDLTEVIHDEQMYLVE